MEKSSMKYPRGSYLAENGENGANSDGMLSTTGDNEGGLVLRKGYCCPTGKRRLEFCVRCNRPWKRRTPLRTL